MSDTKSHIQKREETLKQIRSNNELSTKVFETSIEKEKSKLLNSYLQAYEKALTKIETLENEKLKLNTGKKTFEKDKDGNLVEKQLFDEQAVQRIKKVEEQLKQLNQALDNAMEKGNFELWEKLEKLSK